MPTQAGKNQPPVRSKTIRGHILVVDDDMETRDMTALMLSIEGYTLTTAESREEALTLIMAAPPALVIVDWHMPGMNIDEFIQKASVHKCKFILVTGTTGLVEKARQLGINEFVPKPFLPETLKNAIARALTPGYTS